MRKPIENQRFIEAILYLQSIGKIPYSSELSRILLEKAGYKASVQFISQVLKGKNPLSLKMKLAISKIYEDEINEYLKDQQNHNLTQRGSEAHEDMVKYNARSQGNTYKRMIPVVHYRAQAGFSEGWSDQEWIDDLPTVEVEWPKDGNYLAFEVTGDSMECDCKKNISDRDIVIAREVARHHWVNKLHIPDTFVIVQRMDGILVKEIIKHDVPRGVITCHSNNALFPDFGLSLEDVEKLYHVKEVRRRW